MRGADKPASGKAARNTSMPVSLMAATPAISKATLNSAMAPESMLAVNRAAAASWAAVATKKMTAVFITPERASPPRPAKANVQASAQATTHGLSTCQTWANPAIMFMAVKSAQSAWSGDPYMPG